MTDHDRAMLLSVRPPYAESILTGAKRAEIRHTPDVIRMAEKPSAALRRGRNSSMFHAVEAVARKEAEGRLAEEQAQTRAVAEQQAANHGHQIRALCDAIDREFRRFDTFMGRRDAARRLAAKAEAAREHAAVQAKLDAHHLLLERRERGDDVGLAGVGLLLV